MVKVTPEVSLSIEKIEAAFNVFKQILSEISNFGLEFKPLNNNILSDKIDIEDKIAKLFEAMVFKSNDECIKSPLTFYSFYSGLVYYIGNSIPKFNDIGKELNAKLLIELKKLYLTCLEISPKYKVSALEYFEFMVNDKFKHSSNSQTGFFLKDCFVRFLDDDKLIVFPHEEMLLHLHLKRTYDNFLGTISVEDNNNENRIYIKREYSRWMGVGKDDIDDVEYYKICPYTLKIEMI